MLKRKQSSATSSKPSCLPIQPSNLPPAYTAAPLSLLTPLRPPQAPVNFMWACPNVAIGWDSEYFQVIVILRNNEALQDPGAHSRKLQSLTATFQPSSEQMPHNPAVYHKSTQTQKTQARWFANWWTAVLSNWPIHDQHTIKYKPGSVGDARVGTETQFLLAVQPQ